MVTVKNVKRRDNDKKILSKSPLKKYLKEGDVICSINDGNKTYDLDYYGESNEKDYAGKISLTNAIGKKMYSLSKNFN